MRKLLYGILFYLPVVSFAVPRCPALIANLIQPIYESHYKTIYTYVPQKCFVNAGELARSVYRSLEKDLDLKFAKLLVIKHKNRTDLEADVGIGNDFQKRSAVLAAQNTRSLQKEQYWRYHVVLDYRFQIADMDLLGGENVLPFHKWVQWVIPKRTIEVTDRNFKEFNDPRDLSITEVPIWEYLGRFRSRPKLYPKINYTLSYPTKTVEEYSKESEKYYEENLFQY